MIKPMLAEIAPEPFNDDKHIWEIKYDGVRMIAGCESGNYSLQSRSGRDKTKLYPELNLETKLPAVLDGEVVCYNEDGKPVFKGIQHRANRINNIDLNSQLHPTTYEVFDVLWADGQDLQRLPLTQRKEILEGLLIPTNNVRIAPFTEDGVSLFADMKKNSDHFSQTGVLLGHKEGIIGKRKTSAYRQDKRDWLKIKVLQIGEFVICGYTEGTGWRASTFGALVLGVNNGTGLRCVGSVGTGFDENEISRICQKMASVGGGACPFGREPEKATWIKPVILVLVQYLEMTDDGRLRFPSYKGMIN